MAVVEAHPSIEELTAFTLGTVGDSVHAAIETHISTCTVCQERAAAVPGDSLTELLRSAHARAGCHTEAATQTPSPLSGAVPTITIPPLTGATVAQGVPPETAPPELAGHERYRVLRLLGAGGMGAVYQAEHRVMGRPVAVKVINRAYTTSQGAVERFRREVRNAALLAHPNIVATYDAEDAGDTQFLVMEYVEGMSLGRLVKERGPLPYAQACAYVRQAALGLQHAHERGMVHRDVKPDNLILVASPNASADLTVPAIPAAQASPVASTPGVVKVLDFGLAVLTAERGGGLTDANAVMGTPDFMAPEQAEDARTADIRADVYSLGCTLYYLLTAKVPYPESTSLLKILAHREKPLPSVRRHCPEVPAALAEVLERMLAKKPADRYQTPAEVAAALEPFTQTTAPPLRRRRPGLVALAVAALAIGLIVAGGAIYRIQTDKGDVVINVESPDVEIVLVKGGKEIEVIDTKTNKRVRVPTGTYDVVVKNKPDGIEVKATGRIVVSRGKEVLVTIERIETPPSVPPAQDASTIQVKQRVAVPPGQVVEWTAISPDGKYFGISTPVEITLWDGGSAQRVQTLPRGWFLWTADSKYLVATGDGGLDVYNPEGRKRLRTIPLPAWIHALSCPPSGSHVLAWDDNKIHLCDAATGKVLQSWPMNVDIYYAWSSDGKVLFIKPGGAKSHIAWDVQANKALAGYETLAKNKRIHGLLPGDRQALVSEGGHWLLVNVADGKRVRPIPDLPGPAVASGRGMSDCRVALSGSADGWLHMFDALTAKEQAALRLPDGDRILRDHVIRVTPDGRYVCVGSDRSVYLLSLPKMEWKQPHGAGVRPPDGDADGNQGDSPRFLARIVEPQLHFHPQFSRFSPDGKYLSMPADVWNPKTKVVRVWDAESGKLLRGFSLDSPVTGATFPPDKKQLLACHLDGTFRLWDFETGEQRQVKQFARTNGHTVLWDFSPDGKHVATSEDVGKGMRHFHVWEYETGRERVTAIPLARDSWQHYCRFTPDGKHLVTLDSCDAAATDGWSQIRLHSLASGKCEQTVKVQGWIGPPAAFRDDGRQVGVARYRSADGWGFEFFDIASGKSTGYITTGVKECDFSMTPDGRFGIVCAVGERVRFLDLTTGKEVGRLPTDMREGDRTQILVSPDSRRVAVGRMDGAGGVSLFRLPAPTTPNQVKVEESERIREIRRFEGTPGKHVMGVAISADGGQVLTVGTIAGPGWRQDSSNTLRLYEFSTGKQLATLEGSDRAFSVAFSTDGKTAISGGDRAVRIWNLATGKMVSEWKTGHRVSGWEGTVFGVAFSPDGQHAFSASFNGDVIKREVATGKSVQIYQQAIIPSMALSANRHRLVIIAEPPRWAPSDGISRVRVLDVATGKELCAIPTSFTEFAGVCITPDGGQVAWGHADGTIRVWDVKADREVLQLPFVKGSIHAIAFSLDGKRLLATTSAGFMRLWDAGSGKPIDDYTEPAGVRAVAFSPDGRFVVTGNFDGHARLLRLPDLPTTKGKP